MQFRIHSGWSYQSYLTCTPQAISLPILNYLWASRLTEPITLTSYGEVQMLVHIASNSFTDCWLTNAPWSRYCMFHAPWYTVHYSTTWCPSLDVPGAHCTNKIYVPRQCTASFFKFNWKKKNNFKAVIMYCSMWQLPLHMYSIAVLQSQLAWIWVHAIHLSCTL